MSRLLIPYTFYDLEMVLAAGRSLTSDEETDLIRRGLKTPTDVSDADLTLARATLAQAWVSIGTGKGPRSGVQKGPLAD